MESENAFELLSLENKMFLALFLTFDSRRSRLGTSKLAVRCSAS
jgi:hypothetical protein